MAKFLYQYHEERGQFNAYVSDKDGNTVWEVNYPDYYEDELTGEMLEGSTIFEDGFMRHVDDIQGLEKYLKSMGVLKSDDELVDDEDELEEEEEDYSKGGSVHDLNKVVVYDNNGETLDRYTVFTPDGSVYGMSENAEGFNQYVGDESEIQKGSHLGKRLRSVPEGIKWAVIDRMKENYGNGGNIKIVLKDRELLELAKQYKTQHFGKVLGYPSTWNKYSKDGSPVIYFSYLDDDFTGKFMVAAGVLEEGIIIKATDVSDAIFEYEIDALRYAHSAANDENFDAYEFADGGEIADEIKFKLTKAAAASENGMALPYEIAVYVPSTQDANKIVNRKEFQRRIDEVQKYLAELFGGFSANDVDGGYTSTDKQVIQEDIYRVVSFATKEAAKTKFPELIEQLSIWAGKWGQEAIGLEFEGDMFYVDKKTKLKRGGYFDKGGKLSNLSADEKEFIAKEKKERDGFTYRAKILFGSPVVLKEKNGTPVKKFAVDELPTANIIAEELNKYQDGGTLGAGSFANGGEIKFEIINELDSDDVDDFFDGDTKEIRSWSEGKGRGQTNYTIYTDGKKYLLDIEDFGFDDFKHNYYIIKIKDGDYEQGGTLGAGSFADGGVTKRKSGNEPKVQRKVDELNRLIKLANENDIEITDNTSTWEAPMRYKPVKYTNGTLYLEWEELDLYKANKGQGRNYEKKTEKILKRDMEDEGVATLNFLARRYRNALKNEGVKF